MELMKAQIEIVRSSLRRKRLARFWPIVDAVIAVRGHARILDLGGTQRYWEDLAAAEIAERSVEITVVNRKEEAFQPSGKLVFREGDACDVSELMDGSFDIVHSNSVIEHVGRWREAEKMAKEVSRLANRYFVQTPAFGSPIEPHFMMPFFHWLPVPWRYHLIQWMPMGAYPRATTPSQAMAFVEDATLLSRHQLRALFPAADIFTERVFGVTKSHIAIRTTI